jgi:hypothetical protein
MASKHRQFQIVKNSIILCIVAVASMFIGSMTVINILMHKRPTAFTAGGTMRERQDLDWFVTYKNWLGCEVCDALPMQSSSSMSTIAMRKQDTLNPRQSLEWFDKVQLIDDPIRCVVVVRRIEFGIPFKCFTIVFQQSEAVAARRWHLDEKTKLDSGVKFYLSIFYVSVSNWHGAIFNILSWLVIVYVTFIGLLTWRRRDRGGHCVNCGYSLVGLARKICPECGRDSSGKMMN